MAFYGSLGEVNFDNLDASIADTAVDIFVYDTRKDSDGGAWRKRTQHTSWYNETLNTATRGSRKEFPAVAVIVCLSNYIKIYDGDDPDLPLWMEIRGTTDRRDLGWLWATPVRAASALNGIIALATYGNGADSGGTHIVDFIKDDLRRHSSSGGRSGDGLIITQRGTSVNLNVSTPLGLVVNELQNDVAMTVLPNAPVDPSTGLPIPTIAVATDGGLSIIKDDGTVVDATPSSSGWHPTIVSTYGRNKFIIGSSSGGAGGYILPVFDSDTSYNITSTPPSNGWLHFRSNGTNADIFLDLNENPTTTSLPITALSPIGAGSAKGMNIFDVNDNSHSDSLVAYVTSHYNTGWMHGDIKGAFLSDTDATNKTNGQTDPDRSISNLALTVTGTITKTPVATGAELVGYGFDGSTANYLNQPYNSDLDFGTGDFSITSWFNSSNDATQFICSRNTTNPIALLLITTTGHVKFDFGGEVAETTGNYLDGNWHQCVATRQGDIVSLFVDGELQDTGNGAAANSASSATATLGIGYRTTSTPLNLTGSLALLRISGSAPTAEQIKKMYEDEKVLFQENAKATLYGSSDAVTALAYDEDTDLLHVGTSAGRSDFQGLRRINNTTDAVTTAISASNGLVAEQ